MNAGKIHIIVGLQAFFHLHTSLTILPNCSLNETGEFTVEFMEMHERGLC